MAIAKKKKKFFDVDMPLINKQTQLWAMDISELENKYIKYDLTRILRGKSILLQLKVQVEDGKATSTPTEIKLMPYYLRRMMRKGTDYIEDSFSAECKDAVLLIKPFLITRRRVSKAVRKALREKAKEELINELKKLKKDQVFEDILKNKMQKELSLKLKKIYPLSLCEVRTLKVQKVLEPSEKKKETKKESAEKEE